MAEDPYDQLCHYLDQISKKEEMAAAKPTTNLTNFNTIETTMFEAFTTYLKLTQKFKIATALSSYTDEITLNTYIFGPVSEEQINAIVDFLNNKKQGMGKLYT